MSARQSQTCTAAAPVRGTANRKTVGMGHWEPTNHLHCSVRAALAAGRQTPTAAPNLSENQLAQATEPPAQLWSAGRRSTTSARTKRKKKMAFTHRGREGEPEKHPIAMKRTGGYRRGRSPGRCPTEGPTPLQSSGLDLFAVSSPSLPQTWESGIGSNRARAPPGAIPWTCIPKLYIVPNPGKP